VGLLVNHRAGFRATPTTAGKIYQIRKKSVFSLNRFVGESSRGLSRDTSKGKRDVFGFFKDVLGRLKQKH
jgi:hypothetical protein